MAEDPSADISDEITDEHLAKSPSSVFQTNEIGSAIDSPDAQNEEHFESVDQPASPTENIRLNYK